MLNVEMNLGGFMKGKLMNYFQHVNVAHRIVTVNIVITAEQFITLLKKYVQNVANQITISNVVRILQN